MFIDQHGRSNKFHNSSSTQHGIVKIQLFLEIATQSLSEVWIKWIFNEFFGI